MTALIDETLADCRWPELYRMADYYEKQATILRARAVQLQKRDHMNDKVNLEIEFLKSTPKTVLRYLKQGHCITNAIKITALHTDVPEITVASYWKKFLDSKKQSDVKLRNKIILEMHGLGLSNVAISDRLNLHPVSVSRILKDLKNKRLYNPNPDKLKLFLQREPEQKKRPLKRAA